MDKFTKYFRSTKNDTSEPKQKQKKVKKKNVFRLNELKPAEGMYHLLYDLSKKGIEGKNLLDVGAHAAEWSRLAVQVYPHANVCLIEPLEEMENHLKKFCTEFPNAKYFLTGAGANEDTLLFSLSGVLEGANFLETENEYFKSINLQRDVKLITIDSLIEKKEIEVPEIVKLDVQGYELEVLKGATKLLGNTEVFILEISLFEFMKGTPIFSQVVTYMAEIGYEVYDFPGFLRRPHDNAIGQIDVCFVKREGKLRSSNAWV